MSDVVRGYADPLALLGSERCVLVNDERLFNTDVPVIILPVSDGKCGPFDSRMLNRNTDARNITKEGEWVAIPRDDFLEIRTAIAALFEGDEHE